MNSSILKLRAFSGYSGYSGLDGIASASGYSGYSGDNPGSSGYSGYSGYSGDSTSGYSGYSGYSGLSTSGYSGYSGTNSALTINNNADDRILTANGSPTSIDAESGFTFNNHTGIVILQNDLTPPVYLIEAFSSGSTSYGLGSSVGLVTTSGPTLVTLRSRGTHSAMKAVLNNDTLYQQNIYASYGSGTTVTGTTNIARIEVKAAESYTSKHSTCKSTFTISTRLVSPLSDVLGDRFIIQSDGSVRITGGLYLDETFNAPIVRSATSIDIGDGFSYLCTAVAGTVYFDLPAASATEGRIYYIALAATGSILYLRPRGSDVIGFGAVSAAINFNSKGDFIMIQSDGIDHWVVLSFFGVSY